MKENNVDQVYENLLKSGDAVATIMNGDVDDSNFDTLMDTINKVDIGEDFEQDYTPTKEDLELEKTPVQMYVHVDPYTGKINNVLNDKLNTGNPFDRDLDKLLAMDSEQIKSEVEIDEKSVIDSVKSIFPNFEITDFKAFMDVLNRYRKGEKFSYYNALPQSMKNQVDLIMGDTHIGYISNKEARNYIIQSLFDQIINDNYTNRMFVDIENSFQNSFQELYDTTKGQFSDYNNNFRDFMENKLQDEAEKIKDTDPEKSLVYQNISNAFVSSYTFDDMYDLYINTGKLKVKPIMVDKFKRTCDEWLLKYKDHKMIINNIYDLYPALQKIFSDYSFNDKTYKKFICIFMNYTKNMKPDNVTEHVFMYYFIKNILGIVYCNKDDEKEVKFCNMVKDNVNRFLKSIEDEEGIKNKNNKPVEPVVTN